jgi:hypothetical protein
MKQIVSYSLLLVSLISSSIYAFSGPKSIIAPAFRVNTDSLPFAGILAREDPAAAMRQNGTAVSVWCDKRSGGRRVYYRQYAFNGQALGPACKVNDGLTAQQGPAVAIGSNGSFLVAWREYRSAYSRLFDADGIPLDTIRRIDAGSGVECYDLSAVATDSGFVVAWHDNRTGDNDVYLQMLDTLGHPVDGNVRVNGVTNLSQQVPAVGRTDEGFVVAWIDYRTGSPSFCHVYARRYNAAGDTVGPEFGVTSVSTVTADPAVTKTDNGFWVAWRDSRHDAYDIYFQRYDSTGAALGGNTLVTSGMEGEESRVPSLAGYGNKVALAWQTGDYDTYGDINTRWYNSNGTALSAPVLTNDDASMRRQDVPAALASDSGWAVFWSDERQAEDVPQIYSQYFDTTRAAQGQNVPLCDSLPGYADQQRPAVASGMDGKFLAVWQDYRMDRDSGDICDIYARLYDADGDPLTPDFPASDTAYDQYNRNATDPKVIGLTDGSYMITWCDGRNGPENNVYCQRIDAAGNLSGENILVSAGTAGSQVMHPAIAASDSGLGIFWCSDIYGTYDVFGRLYRNNGDSIGATVLVNDTTGSYQHIRPRAAANNGGLTVIWQDNRTGNSIYGQRLSWEGTLSGTNFAVTDSASSTPEEPSIAGTEGGFMAVWCDYRDDDYRIYGQRLNADGGLDGANFAVSPGFGMYPSVAVSPDGSLYTVLWYGFASGNGILVSQRYQDGVSQGIQEMVVDSTGWWDYNLDGGQNVAVSNNRLFFTFRGYKSESVSRYDIFGTVTDWYATSQPPAIWVDSLPDDIDSAYGPYPINAVIADDGTVDRAVLYYRIGSGSWDTLSMSPGVSDTFTAEIPEQFISVGDTITISYYVWTIDNAKNFISSPISSFKLTGPTGVEGKPDGAVPSYFSLGKAYPNPSRGIATIQYQLPKASDVTLQIFNIAGQLVKAIEQGNKPAGTHSINWNTSDQSAGVYFYRLKAGSFLATNKLVVIK